ncbi:sugar ABC transporter permease [Arthrobacter parietis]|uniref:Sugar ABC transporter permease n=2 Tax=Arthrobacter TaxID=1663 RepID=A0ABT6CTG1_9MICC|nr:sugar ABC transporter permease [Arthrobacter vasquezii]MDF9276885.1 sugar ABC transporter permease [Arthrobacter vasquezii]
MSSTEIRSNPSERPAARLWGRLSGGRRREALTGYAFIGPSVVGFLLFILGPLVAALALSFTKYNILRPPEFVGIDNYVRMFTDSRLLQSYGNTFIYVGAAVVLINTIALAAAVLINQNMPQWLNTIFRSAYFFPYLVALVYVSIIWQALFQKDTGVINYYLTSSGLPEIDWLNSPEVSKLSVIIVDTWRNIGFAMLIYVAALQEVPKEMIEAAEVDGAGPWRRFKSITFPMISQATFFNVTTTTIGAFQIFESIIVLTRGGPGDSSRSVVMYLTEKAFNDFDMGYASAIATSLFMLILLVTLIQFRVRKSWVHYE